jgi:hypothetical protein
MDEDFGGSATMAFNEAAVNNQLRFRLDFTIGVHRR